MEAAAQAAAPRADQPPADASADTSADAPSDEVPFWLLADIEGGDAAAVDEGDEAAEVVEEAWSWDDELLVAPVPGVETDEPEPDRADAALNTDEDLWYAAEDVVLEDQIATVPQAARDPEDERAVVDAPLQPRQPEAPVPATPVEGPQPTAADGGEAVSDAAQPFHRVADRLERIARSLRERAPADAEEANDPLEALITGYALGYTEALRQAGARREGG